MAQVYTEAQLDHLLREREKELRKLDRDNFYSEGGFWRFCKWWDDGFFIEGKTLLKDLAKIYEDMMLFDKYKKIIVSVFPRFGKSYMTTLLGCWLYGMSPESKYGYKTQIMRNSYDDDMAKKYSRDALRIIRSKKYQTKFPHVKLSKHVKETLSWTLQGGTEYSYSGAGLDSGITGKGVKDLRILDDPHKGYTDVISETKSNKAWQNYLSAHLTRDDHTSDCKDIIIGTRWGEGDIIGRVLATSQKGEWTEFIFPILDDNDKSSCEAICSTEKAIELRHKYIKGNEYHIWMAAYQAQPIELEDMLFQQNQLRYFSMSKLPAKEDVVEKICFVDFADKGTDYFSAPIGYVVDEDVYVVDWVFTQEPAEITEDQLTQACKDHRIDRCIVESNAGGRIFANNVQENLYLTNTMVYAQPTSSHKETRIIARSPFVKSRFLFLAEEERDEEYDRAMKQLIRFNKKKTKQKDDAADSIVGMSDMVEYSDDRITMFNY